MTFISWKDPNESVNGNNVNQYASAKLYNKFQDGDYAGEKIVYWIGISAIQSTIHTKNGLSIWSDYKHAPAEYEIELWGRDIQPAVSHIKPTTLSRDRLWL